jgi:hypothetical protein
MTNESDFLSAKKMEGWLRREIADAERALELRTRDAKDFVAAYSRGELSPEEAANRAHGYSVRWGDPLPGVPRSQGMTDEEILRRIDEARAKQRSRYKTSGHLEL